MSGKRQGKEYLLLMVSMALLVPSLIACVRALLITIAHKQTNKLNDTKQTGVLLWRQSDAGAHGAQKPKLV
jgi:hypothetical protein